MIQKAFWAALFFGTVYAQTGLQTAFSETEAIAQEAQPAHFAKAEVGSLHVSATGDFFFNNNAFGLSGILAGGNYLAQDTKDAIISQLDKDNRVQLAQSAGGFVGYRFQKLGVGLSFRQRTSTFFSFHSPQTAALVLNGNEQFAGQTVADEGIVLRAQAYKEIGLLLAGSPGKLSWGIRPKLILGTNASSWNYLDYSLSTAADGTQIDLTANYDMNQSRSGGVGAGIDLGFSYILNDRLSLSGAVNDLGLIKWQGVNWKNAVSVGYTGIDLSALLNGSSQGLFPNQDSLEKLFFPDSTTGSFNTYLPTTLRAAIAYDLDEKNKIGGQILYGFTSYAPSTPLPLMSLSYQRKIQLHPNWTARAGANVSLLGMDTWGLGALLSIDAKLKRNQLCLFYAMDNLSGLAFGGKGVSLNGGIAWKFMPATAAE